MKTLFSLTAVAVTACLSYVAPAQAVTNFTLDEIEGSDLQVDVQIKNVTVGALSGVEIKLDVVPGGNYADLRSVYFHLGDESFLSDTFAIGTGVGILPGGGIGIGGQIDPDDVTDLGLGNDITGLVADTFGGFDVGLNIGTPLGFDNYMSVTFYVASLSGVITEEHFQTLPFAVHAQNVGSRPQWYRRWGTSSLAGIVPGEGLRVEGATTATPEPATAALGLISLAGLTMASRRRRGGK